MRKGKQAKAYKAFVSLFGILHQSNGGGDSEQSTNSPQTAAEIISKNPMNFFGVA
ncbi:hypothetical protein C1H46_007873 [Malus baccata]|uniref:Uncharacterized protein n=1 Tax=Malus baccata TaxID=106549 RepID=A0A540N627_MALBA|nr:hypothetical protein C1H46_007873 [Malus baccata]